MTLSILIVDDSLPMRGVLKKSVRASGFGASRILEAENGEKALALLTRERPDLVITDFNMPVMNGLELLTTLQADPRTRALPVLVVSTEGSVQKVAQIINQGAAGYLKKPFSPEQLRDRLIELLGEPTNEDATADPGDPSDF